jgi:hypothetical protein
MRYLRPLLAVLTLSGIVHATEDALELVPLPLDTLQGELVVTEVPFIIGKALPESAFLAIGLAYIPPSVSFHEQEDINLASIAGIKIKPIHQSDRKYRVELDYGEVAEEYRTDELLTAVVDCIHRVAGRGDENWSVDLTLTNLDPKSPLHATLKRLTKAKSDQDGAK